MANPGTELASLDFGNLIGGPLNAVITAQANAAQSTANFIKTTGFNADNKPIYVDFKYPKEIAPYQAKRNPQLISAKITKAGAGYAANQVVNVTFSSDTGEIAATGNITANADGEVPAGSFVNIINGGDYPTSTSIIVDFEAPLTGTTLRPPETNPLNVKLSTAVAASQAVFQEMQFSVPILTMLPIPFIKVDTITIDFNAKITSMETQSQSSDLSVSASVEGGYGGKRAYVKLNGAFAYKKSTASSASIERTYSMAIHVQASQDEMPVGMEKLLGILENAMISTPGAITSGH